MSDPLEQHVQQQAIKQAIKNKLPTLGRKSPKEEANWAHEKRKKHLEERENAESNQQLNQMKKSMIDMEMKFEGQIENVNQTMLSIATHLEELSNRPPVIERIEKVITEVPVLQKVEVPTFDWNPRKSSMLLWDKDQNGISWENRYKGGKIFLVCGGPSLNDLDLSLMDNRGVMSMCMNNSWCMVKPDFWIGFDVPGRFHTNGWMDPSIIKFVPWHQRLFKINHRVGDVIVDKGIDTTELPNCWYLSNTTTFDLDTWFTERNCNWGGKVEGLKPEGGFRVTMIGALRLLYYLGFQEVYLTGCDWEMPTDMNKEAYAWEEDRAKVVREKNNDMYNWIENVFKKLQPGFDEANFRIYNCNKDSKLRLFPFIEYEEAIERCTVPDMKGTRGWYNVPNVEKNPSG